MLICLLEEHHLQQLVDCLLCSFSASRLPWPLPWVPVPSFLGSFLAESENEILVESLETR